MFKFVVLVSCVLASAQAGLLTTGALPLATSYAAGPALGAPLLGRTTINAPETTIVKQPVVIDQHETRYRAVPTIVQTPPVVKTITPVIQQQQVVQHYAAPIQQQVIAPPQLVQQQVVSAPALTYSAGIPAVQTIGASWNGIQTIGAPGLGLGYGFGTHIL